MYNQDICASNPLMGFSSFLGRGVLAISFLIKATLLNCLPTRLQNISKVWLWPYRSLHINCHSYTVLPFRVMHCNWPHSAVISPHPQLVLALGMFSRCHGECAPSRVIRHRLEKHCVNNQSSRAKDINGANYKSEQIYSFC